MKVKITTDFGEMAFDMPQGAALDLIDRAMRAASESEAKTAWTPALEPLAKADPAPTPAEKAAPRSRAESMFGSREGWNMPAAGNGKSNAERLDGKETYKGFLFIRCEERGEVKGFYAKYPMTYHQCGCGHRTELHDLRPAYVSCKCGETFKYMTNLEYDFTIPCKACGSPVDMEMGAKGTAFVTVGQKFFGGGHAIMEIVASPMYSGRIIVFEGVAFGGLTDGKG